VFSPAVAHLANGVAIEDLGPAIEPDSLVQLDVPQPEVTKRRIRACCLYVDRFGNMQLNLTREHLEQLGIEPGTRVELELGSERYYAVAARTYADARPGEIILYEDAYQNIAVAISGGSAAETFFAQPGVDVRIRLAD
jgi:S-adenosylmethionine hydrolase